MTYFVKLKDLMCNFCGFYHFFNFSASFYPNWMKIISKLYQNFRPTRLLSWFGLRPVQTGPRTTVFSGPCSDEMEGPGPRSSQVRSWSGPVHQSYAVLRTGPLSTSANAPLLITAWIMDGYVKQCPKVDIHLL